MKKLKKTFVSNIIFNIIALVSTILALIFCIYIYKLDMIPSKYLKIAFIAIGVIYLILLTLTLPHKINKVVKVICCFFFIVNALIFGYGIKFSGKTMSTLDKINYELSEKVEYELKVLSASTIVSKEDLHNKKIGVYKDENYDDVVKYLKKDVDCELIDYDSPVKIFQDLLEKNIDGVIANDMVYAILGEDLSYMELEVKTVHIVEVPSKGETNDIVKVVDVTNTPFNIYLSGGDKRGPIRTNANTDVNMIISVDPVNRKILLTSIPRDYYVNLPSKGEEAYDKLTHVCFYGMSESIKSIENLMDININYYVRINFTTVIKLVDAIGGVDVNNPRAFRSRVGDYYEKGNLHLNGKYALAFSRERKAFYNGDVTRVQNQQLVLTAIIKKITSSKTLVLKYSDMLDAFSDNFLTNIDRASINRLVKMQLSDMKSWTITSQHLDGTPAYSTKCYTFPKYNLYVMLPNENSIKNNKKAIDALLAGNQLPTDEDK